MSKPWSSVFHDVQNVHGRPHNSEFYYDVENLNLNTNVAFQWPVISSLQVQPVRKKGRPLSTGAKARGTRGGSSSRGPKVAFSGMNATSPSGFLDSTNNSATTAVERSDCFSSDFWASSSSTNMDHASSLDEFSSSEVTTSAFPNSYGAYNQNIFWDSYGNVPEAQEEFVCETVVEEKPSTSLGLLSNIKLEPMDSWGDLVVPPELTTNRWPENFDVKEEAMEEAAEADEVVAIPDEKFPGLKPISAYEEFQLMKRLEHANGTLEDSVEARRIYRKLSLRHDRRTKRLPQFDFDKLVRRLGGQAEFGAEQSGVSAAEEGDEKRVLDRFQMKSSDDTAERLFPSFRSRLLGGDESKETTFVSPYSHKTLKTVIWRDHEARPLKLRILQDVLSAHLNKGKRGGDHPCSEMPEKASVGCIEYQYIRPHHISAINTVARDFFWPGIDTSDCLQYPEFTCVALYRKIVVGFAVMVPDVGFNEAYISFLFTHPEWRGVGIAKFMMYHLIQLNQRIDSLTRTLAKKGRNIADEES